MRACGSIGAGSSKDPAGIMTLSESLAWRGMRAPQVAQKLFVNRLACGTLNAWIWSSPWSHLRTPGWKNRLEACPVPLALRQRVQWQWKKNFGSPLTSYFTAPQRQLPLRVDEAIAAPMEDRAP